MILQSAVILFTPAVLIIITTKFKALRFIGPILLAYLVGIIAANVPIGWDRNLSMTLSEITVPIAIPLVLMSTNLVKWFHLARTTVVSFILMMVSALLASLLTVAVFRDQLDNSWQIAGMLTGCYTGGTPNLIAVGMSLEVPSSLIVLANTSDMLWGGLYFILLTSVMKNVYRKFLKPFQSDTVFDASIEPFMKPVFGNGIKLGIVNIGITVGIAIACAGSAIGLSFLITGGLSMVPILLMVTTIGIALSFWKPIHRIEGTWNIAEYIILLFSIGLGGTVDLIEFFKLKLLS